MNRRDWRVLVRSTDPARVANLRGRMSENAVDRVLVDLARRRRAGVVAHSRTRPGARAADFVVLTDAGAVLLQVKSSRRQAARHRRRYPSVPVVVVHAAARSGRSSTDVLRRDVEQAVRSGRVARAVA